MLARCLIAKHCLYGVDKNPKAVELGRWSLWLAMENPDIPLDYFDQNLKYGDAVVGCTVEQISAFDWSQKDNTQSKLNPLIQELKMQRLKLLEEGVVDTQNIVEHIESISYRAKKTGDLLVACVWAGGSRVQVQKRIQGIRLEINQLLRGDFSEDATQLLDDFERGEFGFKPFHWELEFPEVFFDTECRVLTLFGESTVYGKGDDSCQQWKGIYQNSSAKIGNMHMDKVTCAPSSFTDG